MIKRRGAILRNIWWLLAILIIAGMVSNYFFMKSSPIFPINPTPEKSASQEDANGKLLDIQTWQTSRGLSVFFLPIHNLPIIDLRVIFAAGSAYDGQTPGLAQLTSQVIGRDTDQFTTDQLAERFESLGTIVDSEVSRDSGALSLRTVSFENEKTAAINLFTHMLSNIRFTEDSLTQEREELLTMLSAQAQSPDTQAAKAFNANLYGTHPYATPVFGNVESVSALTLDAVNTFYSQYYNSANAVFVIVGDVTREDAEKIAEQLEQALPQGEAAAAIPVVELPAAPIFQNIDFPSSQKHILLGLPTLEKGNPDFFAFYVGNQILGGSGLSSQLFAAVREKEGLAYSVNSQVMSLKQKGPFLISLQTRNDESDVALLLVKEHLNDFIKHGPSQAEIEHAKQNIAGKFLMAFDSNAAIAGSIGVLAFYKFPLDYYDHYIKNINVVTLDDITRVFNKYVQPEHMVTVTLGENDAPPQP